MVKKISISVKFYGELRDRIPYKKLKAGIPNTLKIENHEFKIVLDLLKEFGIDENDVSHIFVNGIYSGAGKVIKNGDRIGIFPKRMGLMFMEITKIKSIYIKITLHEELKEFGLTEVIVDLPEGSTLNSVLNKYRLYSKKDNLEVIINGKPVHEYDYILKDWDNIAIFPV